MQIEAARSRRVRDTQIVADAAEQLKREAVILERIADFRGIPVIRLSKPAEISEQAAALKVFQTEG